MVHPILMKCFLVIDKYNMNDTNNKPEYQTLANRPVACTYCGNHVQGRLMEQYDPRSKQSNKIIRWNCGRCGNTVRIGKPQE